MIVYFYGKIQSQQIKREKSEKVFFTDKSNCKQEVQGLQAFAFPVVTVNDKHSKSRFKKSLGVKFKEGICAKL